MSKHNEIKEGDGPMLKEFKRAYKRLKSHTPQDADNINLMQSGKLRINKTTLAREAHRSRTTYHNHPDVLSYAEEMIDSPPRAKQKALDVEDLENAISDYRKQTRDLKKTLDDLRTQMAELICYIHYLEKTYKVVVRDSLSTSPYTGSIAGRTRVNPAAVREIKSTRKRPNGS